MTLWDAIKDVWPIAAILGAFGLRVEVGQALNKQRLSQLEKVRESDANALHSRISRHEKNTADCLKEIRDDIKVLLQK